MLWDTTGINDQRCVPQRGSLIRVVSHNGDHWPALFPTTWIIDSRCGTQRGKNIFLEYLPQIAKEIKIPLDDHSVGTKEGFDAKNRRPKISWHCPFNMGGGVRYIRYLAFSINLPMGAQCLPGFLKNTSGSIQSGKWNFGYLDFLKKTTSNTVQCIYSYRSNQWESQVYFSIYSTYRGGIHNSESPKVSIEAL